MQERILRRDRSKQQESKLDEFGRTEETRLWSKLDFGQLTEEQRRSGEALLRRGDVSWFLSPIQNNFIKWIEDQPRKRTVINVCRQTGKSFGMVAFCIAYCIKNPGVHVIYIAPSKLKVKEIVLPAINAVFSYLPDDLLPHKSGETWTFRHNNSSLNITGCNVEGGTRLRGTPAHLVVIDECRDIKKLEDIIDSSIVPMFTSTNGRLVLISTPPDSPLHPFTSVYIAQAIKGGYYFEADYKSNPFLTRQQIRDLLEVEYPGGEENLRFRREFMADYSVTDPNKLIIREYSAKADDDFFASYEGPPLMVRPYTVMDYGYTDPCGIIFGYYDWKLSVFVVLNEFFQTKMIPDEVASAIKEFEAIAFAELKGKTNTKRIMDIDPALLRELKEKHHLDFSVVRKLPNDKAMINRLRTNIKEGKIRVHPRCVNLRFQLRAGVWNNKGTDFEKTDKGGHLDLLDALKYANMSMAWDELLHGPGDPEHPGPKITIPGPFGYGLRGGIIQRPR